MKLALFDSRQAKLDFSEHGLLQRTGAAAARAKAKG
jgi:hypothetical protein